MNPYPNRPIRRTIGAVLTTGLPVTVVYSFYEGDAPDVEEVIVSVKCKAYDLFASLNENELASLAEDAQQEEFDRAADAAEYLDD